MKIRKFKKQNIVNEDVQPAPQAQPAPQQQTVATPQNQPVPQQSEDNQKMNAFLNDLKAKIDSGDAYWALSYNLPEELQKAVPDFKQGNQSADAGIKSWEAYKQNPSQQSFQTLIGELSKFGAQPAEQQQQPVQNAQPVQQQQVAQTVQQQQQVAPQQQPATPQVHPNVATQPAQNAPVQNAVNAQAQQESLMKSFGKRLHESLEREMHNERIHSAIVENAAIGHPNGWIA